MRRCRSRAGSTAEVGPLLPAGVVVRALVTALTIGCLVLIDPHPARAATAHDTGKAGHAPAADGPSTDVPQGEPLTDSDRDLLVKVRLAGLWEMPAGSLAARKGASPRVREIGTMISSQHRELDTLVVQTAKQLGVTLPDQPNADQEQWLEEMRDASGEQFDRVFIDRLRAAHGKVFPAIAVVRAATRNTTVRRFATSANDFVLTHLNLLESTGLVEYSNLPAAPAPAPSAVGESVRTNVSGAVASLLRTSTSYPGIIIGVAGLLLLQRILRHLARRRSRSARRAYRRSPRAAPPEPYERQAALPAAVPSSPVTVHPSRRLRDNPVVRP